MSTWLVGESRLIDASALVLLRSAVAATAASVSVWGVAADFVWAVVCAVVIGLVVGRLNLVVRRRIHEAPLNTAISFVVPFVAYVPAEHFGASGLVAAVTAGLVTGVGAPKYLRPQDRLYERANWRTIELLLEGGVFLLMGLELYGVLEDVQDAHGSPVFALLVGLAAGAIILAIRSAYVLPILLSARRKRRNAREHRQRVEDLQQRLDRGEVDTFRERHVRRRIGRAMADMDYLMAVPLGWREGVVLVWAGMRGVVTLAAAQSLPVDSPERSTLILVAFVVAAGTLLVQGGTLPWVVRALGLAQDEGGGSDPDLVELQFEMSRAAAKLLDSSELRAGDGTPYDAEVVERARRALLHAQSDDAEEIAESRRIRDQVRELRLRTIEVEREALLRARALGSYSSAALSEALAILDADQITLELRAGSEGDDES